MKQAHLSTVSIPIERLVPHPQNPNTHDDRQIKKLRHLIKTHGYSKGSVVYQLSTHHILAGHGLVTALKAEGYTHVDAVELDIDDDKAKAFMIADNKIADDSVIDNTLLNNLISELSAMDVPSLDFGFDSDDLSELADRILADSGGLGSREDDTEHVKLSDRFIVPPFSVLDARAGYWQDRKRAWIALGIKSELGRGGAVANGIGTGDDTELELLQKSGGGNGLLGFSQQARSHYKQG